MSTVISDSGPFAICPEWLVEDSAVSDGAVRLYLVLARHADKATGEAIPSRRRLADRLGCSVDTVDRRTKELLDAGALIVEPRYDSDGDRTSNLYTVLRARRPDRTDAATVGGQDAATSSRADAAVNESQFEREPQNESSSPSLLADEPQRSEAKAARGASKLTGIKADADRITRQHWESHTTRGEPAPMLPGNAFAALRKIVEAALRAHFTEELVLAGLDELYGRGYSTQQLYQAMERRRSQGRRGGRPALENPV